LSRAGHALAEPPVVVTIVVDQLAAWIVEERLAGLPADGGFARLRREGTWVPRMDYGFAATETSPGHASLYTGRLPSESGIFANMVLDANGEPVGITTSERSRLLMPPPLPATDPATPAAGLERLRLETLADRLRAAHADAYIVSLSVKDRGAIFAGGRRPDASLWYDSKRQTFVTATSVARQFPAWAVPVAGPDPIGKALGSLWSPLDPKYVAGVARVSDDAPGEGDLGGYSRTFPHRVARTAIPGSAWRAGPGPDRILVDMALAALAARPRERGPTLLAISFSSLDYVGHVFGPDSHEHLDTLLRLDRELARLFSGLDARYGRDGWAALLSADHGIPPLPEAARLRCEGTGEDPYERPCKPGTRLFEDVLGEELRKAAAQELGSPGYVGAVVDPYVYLGPVALASENGRIRALAWLERALEARPEIREAFIVGDLPSECPEEQTTLALVCRTVPRGDPLLRNSVAMVLEPGSFFDTEWVPGCGANHGSPYRYDRLVPLFARAPGKVEAGTVDSRELSFTTFTRTAADLLGIEPWDESLARAPSLVAPPKPPAKSPLLGRPSCSRDDRHRPGCLGSRRSGR
jgi:hypothetical protein